MDDLSSLSGSKNQKGTVFIMVLFFSSLLAAAVIISWNTAILQNKMAANHLTIAQDFIKAEASLNNIQRALVQNPALGTHLQFESDNLLESPLAGVDYYQIHSDPNLKVKLQAIIAIYRDKNGIARELKRKTWEEVRD